MHRTQIQRLESALQIEYGPRLEAAGYDSAAEIAEILLLERHHEEDDT